MYSSIKVQVHFTIGNLLTVEIKVVSILQLKKDLNETTCQRTYISSLISSKVHLVCSPKYK